MSFKQYRDMNEAERAQAADELTALFVGLPGVVGAPMVMGEGYWRDVSEHLLELGVRVVADPIKHYQVGESIDRAEAAGRYIYDEDVTPPQSPSERYAEIADEQRRALEEKAAAMRAEGTLAKAGASPSERAAARQRRAARAEGRAFKAEQRDRRANDTLRGSPLDGVGKPKRKR